MKRSALLSAVLLSLSSAAPAAQVVNRSVATVNGETVLLSEFEKNWAALLEQQGKMIPPDQMTPEWKREAKRKILEQLIDNKILLQEAKKRKLRVNQREMESGVLQVKARFLPQEAQGALQNLLQRQMAGKSPEEQQAGPDFSAAWAELQKAQPDAVKKAEEEFKKELAKEGLTDKKFQERVRDELSVVQVSQAEVRARSKAPSDQDAKALFDRVMTVMQGKPAQGGDPEETRDLQSMADFFKDQTGERVRARHILIRAGKDASFKDKSAARKKAQELRSKLVAGADFVELAEKNSEDPGTAKRGGDLGFFTRGQMVAPFEKAAFDLAVGKISDVVETDFGYHILRVEEKRAAAKLRYEDVQDDMKEYLFRSGAQKVFESYVKELRKGADVKISANLDEIGG